MPAPNATGSHGISRPGATSTTAHSRSFAASGAASPATGTRHGAAAPAVPGRGHVPTCPCALLCPATRAAPPRARSLADFRGIWEPTADRYARRFGAALYLLAWGEPVFSMSLRCSIEKPWGNVR
jgi:hypothetical protein